MKESIREAAAEAATPSQFLARLSGAMSAHGEDAERLMALAADAALAEQDSRTLKQWLKGCGHDA